MQGATSPTPAIYFVSRGRTTAQKLGGYSPIHISKTVLSTVKSGPPNWTKLRIFMLRFSLVLKTCSFPDGFVYRNRRDGLIKADDPTEALS